jgi:hypothetical protein
MGLLPYHLDALLDKYYASKPPPLMSGMTEPGNINLYNRPEVKNPDGSISTVLSFSIGTDRGEVLIPQVVNGKVVSQQEAIQHYKDTGEHLGVFATPDRANAYAEQLHNDYAAGKYRRVTGKQLLGIK